MADRSTVEQAMRIELKINGEEIPLNDFVQRFITGTLCGMLRSLRGVDDIRVVNLTLTSEPK
jgi:hypothetical protein